MKTARIQLSDHFTYGRLLRFTLPSITMMIFTSIYSVVDGYFQSVEKPGLRIRIDRVSRQTETTRLTGGFACVGTAPGFLGPELIDSPFP